jgi:hypothetical protein
VTGLKTALINKDADTVVREFNRLLSRIPYEDYNASLREIFEIRNPYVDFGEWLYRSTLLSYLYGAGLRVDAERHGHKGRADIVVEFKGRVWVMELKMARGGMDAVKLADEALSQIEEKGYAEPFGDAVLLGLAIDIELRRVAEFRVKYVQDK